MRNGQGFPRAGRAAPRDFPREKAEGNLEEFPLLAMSSGSSRCWHQAVQQNKRIWLHFECALPGRVPLARRRPVSESAARWRPHPPCPPGACQEQPGRGRGGGGGGGGAEGAQEGGGQDQHRGTWWNGESVHAPFFPWLIFNVLRVNFQKTCSSYWSKELTAVCCLVRTWAEPQVCSGPIHILFHMPTRHITTWPDFMTPSAFNTCVSSLQLLLMCYDYKEHRNTNILLF